LSATSPRRGNLLHAVVALAAEEIHRIVHNLNDLLPIVALMVHLLGLLVRLLAVPLHLLLLMMMMHVHLLLLLMMMIMMHLLLLLLLVMVLRVRLVVMMMVLGRHGHRPLIVGALVSRKLRLLVGLNVLVLPKGQFPVLVVDVGR